MRTKAKGPSGSCGDSEDEDWRWEREALTTARGSALLEAIGEMTGGSRVPGPRDLERLRGRFGDARLVSAGLRLSEARRRASASGKFADAGRMWLDPVGLQQATAEAVAEHKACRFGAGTLAVDLCCGIGGDARALARRGPTIAIDRDAGMCRRAAWNLRLDEESGSGSGFGGWLVARGDAEALIGRGWPGEAARVHVDPDRRASGVGDRRVRESRARDWRDYRPGREALRALARRRSGGAFKLGPADDWEGFGVEILGGMGWEVEITSLRGECKEATIWHGEEILGSSGARRRATALPGGRTFTDRDGPAGWEGDLARGDLDRSEPARAGDRIFEPDAALCRAGLTGAFAARHGLRRYPAGVDWLIGSGSGGCGELEEEAAGWLRAFEVLDDLPLDPGRLRRRLRGDSELSGAPLVVKTRNLDRSAEAIRAEALSGSGSGSGGVRMEGGRRPLALLCARATGSRGARVILARPV